MTNAEHKIRTNWDEIRNGLRRDYSNLTDEDLKYKEGDEGDLLRRLEKRLDMSSEAMEEYIQKYPDFEERKTRRNDDSER